MLKRTERVVSIEEAVAVVKDGDTVGLSGLSALHEPMALVRALIRRGVKDLTLVCLGGGIAADMLIGAGCVKKVIATYMGVQQFRPILYFFRDKVAKGELDFWQCDFLHWDCALKCAHWGMPCMYTKAGLGTDITQVNPDLKEVEVEGERWIKVPPVEVDVALLYINKCDPYGNGIYNASYLSERMLAEAAKRAIVMCADELIPLEETKRDPRLVAIGGPLHADYVVYTPWGAHPTEAHAYYGIDEKHINEFFDVCEATVTGRDPQAFQRYLDKYVYGPKTQAEYLEAIGGITRLLEIKQLMI